MLIFPKGAACESGADSEPWTPVTGILTQNTLFTSLGLSPLACARDGSELAHSPPFSGLQSCLFLFWSGRRSVDCSLVLSGLCSL